MAESKLINEPIAMNVALMKASLELKQWKYKEAEGETLNIRFTFPSSLLNQKEKTDLESQDQTKFINNLFLLLVRYGETFLLKLLIKPSGLSKSEIYRNTPNEVKEMINNVLGSLGKEPIQLLPFTIKENISGESKTSPKEVMELNEKIISCEKKLKDLDTINKENDLKKKKIVDLASNGFSSIETIESLLSKNAKYQEIDIKIKKIIEKTIDVLKTNLGEIESVLENPIEK